MKNVFSTSNRASSVSAFSALLIAATNKAWNHWRLYWYIGSTTHKFTTEKYKIVARYATGRYLSRYASISCSVTSASATFSVISVEVILDDASVSMSCVGRADSRARSRRRRQRVNFKVNFNTDSRTSWSSRMFPVLFESM